jgi:hypothetical protein
MGLLHGLAAGDPRMDRSVDVKRSFPFVMPGLVPGIRV